MDPLSIIASTIAVVQATALAYKAIQNLRGLPKEFNEVSRNLPLAEDTLRLARDQLQGQTLDEPSKAALGPLASGCEEKAKKLRDIFGEVQNGVKNAKDGSVLDLYRTCLLRLGKAHRVETLMQGILRDLDALATNPLFRTATKSMMTQLKGAIDQLSKVRSSVPDSDFDGSGKSFNQTNQSGGTGYLAETQYNNPGSGQQNHFSGNVHTVNLVPAQNRPKPSIMVPCQRDSAFVGRKDIIAKILEHEQAAAGNYCWVALVGLGGVGKSQIAIEYAYRARESPSNVNGRRTNRR